jgi:hypothetical protein
LARSLNHNKALNLQRTPLAELWRHPLHTREMGSQLTNVLRCLYLESQGYKVTVTELVGWEHSMKNELILAQYTGQKKKKRRGLVVGFCDHFRGCVCGVGFYLPFFSLLSSDEGGTGLAPSR